VIATSCHLFVPPAPSSPPSAFSAAMSVCMPCVRGMATFDRAGSRRSLSRSRRECGLAGLQPGPSAGVMVAGAGERVGRSLCPCHSGLCRCLFLPRLLLSRCIGCRNFTRGSYPIVEWWGNIRCPVIPTHSWLRGCAWLAEHGRVS
jgi:hypothetical protein